jgi:DNA polymerase type B, organellar and viral
MLSGKISNNIRLSYTGGSTDMFIPKPPIDTKIYAYDVNSLYPSVMLNNKYPIGSPVYFEGNLYQDKPNNVLGFYYCKITTCLRS